MEKVAYIILYRTKSLSCLLVQYVTNDIFTLGNLRLKEPIFFCLLTSLRPHLSKQKSPWIKKKENS